MLSTEFCGMKLPRPLWMLALFGCLYLLAVPVDTMDVDASQYASMSREMMESGSYLQVYEQGRDYLDKPPFLFWINSLFMLLFGANNFAFKFPSILFALLALFATYRLARLYYNEQLARLALLVLGTTQALFLITNDIKTDTILMGWVALALWQLATWMETKKKAPFFIGCAAIAFGMMTKGPIALLVPVFALGSHLLLTRRWKLLLQPVLPAGLLLIAVLLLPMSYGLYQQFDLHPEKTVNGMRGVSGLRFFYWTQSFGRITGESVWNNGASFTFLFENLLWAWLPWTIFLITGLLTSVGQLLKNRLRLPIGEEGISSGGFVITYCSLAVSKFQLPHYIYVVLPLAAIITAKPLYRFLQGNLPHRLSSVLHAVQWLVVVLLLVFPYFLLTIVFPQQAGVAAWMVPVATALAVLRIAFRSKSKAKLLYASMAAIIGANILLSTWFYPNLLYFQASNNAGRFIQQQNVPQGKFVMFQYKGNSYSVHFYSRQIVPRINAIDSLPPNAWLLTGKEGKQSLDRAGYRYEVVKSGPDFHISTLTPAFLNAQTRASVLDTFYILKLQQ